MLFHTSPDAAMTPERFLLGLSIAVAVLGIAKVLFNVAGFFITLGKSVETLTATVEKMGVRFDEHTVLVMDELSDIRERVARLEGFQGD